ncbi:aminoglycoside phosphotransferase family protein [Streptomyces oceani]|uniref:Hydroxyurea phosphotransferase n=1 Tax=Streptomyces oceani TaxID=1075402 RepID=A0A1E7KK25_9ACTN|nr:aminoglycoside phosphotransferase family protein [Streptomyces oceani]OEV04197.1 hydroxyurea phosphotransferase [Streptomyces oceani]
MAHDRIPASLPVATTMRRHASGRAWLAELPAMISDFVERWELRLGLPFHGGSCSWAAPAWRRDEAEPLVFKITWPHPEATSEGMSLRNWSGRGAVRVLAHDAERYALLLERCTPGTPLARTHGTPAEERLACAADVLRTLWSVLPPGTGRADTYTEVPTPAATSAACRTAAPGTTAAPPATAPYGVPPLARITAEWADIAEERAHRVWPDGIDPGLFALAAELMRKLPESAEHTVLLHGDFNPGNVLAARRSPWLAIDPKPMTGDPAFDPWPLIEQVDAPFAYPEPRGVLLRRTAMLAELLGQDVSRLRAWTVVRHLEHALWSVVEDDDMRRSISLMRQSRVLADVAGL